MDAIRCEGLRKCYGRFTGLEQLDLTVPVGSVFGFLGPNGAGKTTTVRLLTGLSRPSRGRAWVAGEAVDPRSRSFRAKIGYLPEEPAFYNWMTGEEYLAHVGQLFGLGSKPAAERAKELLAMVGLSEASRRRAGGYSRGMRQRLGLAQAMLNRPAVLFLDEPCSALDPIGRREVLELIQRLRGETTVFMSTHILADVERVCDRVAIVDHGRLVRCATVDDLQARRSFATFEVEFAERADDFVPLLSALPWIESVERDRNRDVLRIYARDAEAAPRELLAIVLKSGLTLLRYEVVTPTLEDAFVALVGRREQEVQS